MSRNKITFEEVVNRLNSYKLYLLDKEYINDSTRMSLIDEEGYKYFLTLNGITKNPWKFYVSNIYTEHNIILWLNKNSHLFKERLPILKKDQKYLNSKTKLTWICSNCKNEFNATFDRIQNKSSCPYCCNPPKKLLKDYNSLSAKRPDLLIYFKNKKDAEKVYPNSTKMVNLICPFCKKERKLSCDRLSGFGFSCPFCFDGISIPNKFLRNLFKQFNYKITTEKTLSGAKHRYDLYVKTKTQNYTIEAHGIQHYKYNGYFRPLKEQQKIDRNKRILSESLNNIHIEIDCRHSDFNYLKEQFIKSLSPYFDLSDIDWNKLKEDVYLSSLLLNVCDSYNQGMTISNLSSTYNICCATVMNYLKRGNELNICT